MVGGVRRITPSFASILCLRKVLVSCCKHCWGTITNLQPLKQLLIERTEGNPFFLEESVRTLVETKLLVGERGNCRLVRPIESTQVPATVQAVLAARIDRLPPEEKRLLQTAAVIGKDVLFLLLQSIADQSEEDTSP